MSGRPVSGASSVFTLLPITCITACTLPPVRSATVLDSQISGNLAVNHALEGSRLCAPCENLMPDDLILHYGDLLDYFIIYHNVIVIEIKHKINVVLESSQNQPLDPSLWKNCLP